MDLMETVSVCIVPTSTLLSLEPIEIRGVRYDWGLQSRKMYYKSIVMADVKKIVVMIANDEQHVYRVRIYIVWCNF